MIDFSIDIAGLFLPIIAAVLCPVLTVWVFLKKSNNRLLLLTMILVVLPVVAVFPDLIHYINSDHSRVPVGDSVYVADYNHLSDDSIFLEIKVFALTLVSVVSLIVGLIVNFIRLAYLRKSEKNRG